MRRSAHLVLALFIVVAGFVPSSTARASTPTGFTSVQDAPYHAVGDGRTDDTTALVAAVESGRNIYFPPGDYLTRRSLRVQSGQHVLLAVDAAVKFHGQVQAGPASSSRAPVFCVCGVRDVTITGGIITDVSDWSSHRVMTDGIWVRGGRNVGIRNVHIENFANDGVYIDEWSHGQYAEDTRLEDLIIERVGRNGISLTSGRNISVLGVQISDWLMHNKRGSGVHMEPNGAARPLQGIRIIDLHTRNMEEVLRVNLTSRTAAGGDIDVTAIRSTGIANRGATNYMFRNASAQLAGRIILQAYSPDDVHTSNWSPSGPSIELSDSPTAIDARSGTATEGDPGRESGRSTGEGAERNAETTQPQASPRLAGTDRILTAVAISRAAWRQGAEMVLLADARNFPDALAAGALAAEMDAPLLLTPTESLPASVANEILRLGADQVLVLGGEAAVSRRVADHLAQLDSGPSVRRIGGADRFETARAVLDEVRRHRDPTEVAVASGTAFADSLAAGALTSLTDGPPVVLVDDEPISPATVAAISSLNASQAWIVGGKQRINDSLEAELARYSQEVNRLAGRNRYSTSVSVLSEALRRLDGAARPLVIATGSEFPDALAATALTARLDGSLLLVPGHGTLPEETALFLRDNAFRFDDLVIVGGPSAITHEVERELMELMANG